MVSPLRVGDVVRDGIPREKHEPEHQPRSTDGLQPNISPSFLPRAPHDKLLFACAPNDLEQKHPEVAVPEDCRAKTDAPIFDAFSVRTSTQHRTTRKMKASSHDSERGHPCPWVFRRLTTQF